MTEDIQTSSPIVPSPSFQYYTGSIYWNDFEVVAEHMNAAVSGDANEHWMDYVRRRYGVARKVFVPNCGNGWVEREMIARGATLSAIGADISRDLIDAAARAASAAGIDASYRHMDSNDLQLSGMNFDRIVNFAAFHHIAFLDQALRRMLEEIDADGLLIGYDYTGPHRNQYPWETWRRVVELNAELPADFRADLVYPHQKTMIHMDPTEAVHSELILDHISRYFSFEDFTCVGGALAYPLLYDNKKLFEGRRTPDGGAVLARILGADAAYTEERPENSFFTFWVARPKKFVLEQTRQLALWSYEERVRERRAAANGMRYHPPSALEIVYDEIADLKSRVT